MSGTTSTGKTVTILTTQQAEVKIDRNIPAGATAVEPTFTAPAELTVTKGNAFTPANESAVIQPSGGMAGTYTVMLDSGQTTEDTLAHSGGRTSTRPIHRWARGLRPTVPGACSSSARRSRPGASATVGP